MALGPKGMGDIGEALSMFMAKSGKGLKNIGSKIVQHPLTGAAVNAGTSLGKSVEKSMDSAKALGGKMAANIKKKDIKDVIKELAGVGGGVALGDIAVSKMHKEPDSEPDMDEDDYMEMLKKHQKGI